MVNYLNLFYKFDVKCCFSRYSLYFWSSDIVCDLVNIHLHGQTIMIVINNGNRTEWSPIRSVIIRVINKIGRPRSGSPICLSRV